MGEGALALALTLKPTRTLKSLADNFNQYIPRREAELAESQY